MKNVLLLMVTLSVLVGCGPDYKQQVVDLKSQNDSLLNAYRAKDSELVTYMQDISDIQTSISVLTAQEQVLKVRSEGQITQDAKTQIISDLESIRKELQSSKSKLAAVQAKLKSSNAKIASLESMISSLQKDLVARDASIAELSQKIGDLSNKVASSENEVVRIKAENEQKAQEIAEKTIRLNTAYYTVGTYKALRDKQVISNNGAVFKSKELDPNFNTNAFTRIDITNTKVIALNDVKDVKVITTHPSDSYSVVKENNKVKQIEVTNPDKFWASSKYLVIVTN